MAGQPISVAGKRARRLTSYVPEDGGPAGFYQRLGFVPSGELDENGEVIVRRRLPSA